MNIRQPGVQPFKTEPPIQAFGGAARQRYLREIGSPRDFPLITRALVERGWSAAEVKGLLGENFMRALEIAWKS